MDADRNLLFGVLALQADLIDTAQFIEACVLWTSRKREALADLLVERGWIDDADRGHVEYLLERKLRRHGGDAHATLAGIPENVKCSLAAIADDDIQHSLAALPCGPSASATIDHVAGSAERYCRLRLHATGGIGRVWLAHDSGLGRDVALKELRPERADNVLLGARFLQEAQITGQLEHPGIVPVYDLVRAHEGAQQFYTMRFVNGRTLSDAAHTYHAERRAGKDNPVALPTLLNAFVTVCNTVAYAHSRGVIHRDLKGRNVVHGDFGEVVVLDWGLAKVVGRPECEAGAPSLAIDVGAESGYTVQGQAVGTPAYMAPEQAAGQLELIGPHTDVYGLGAILYEVLTGLPPFSGPTTEAVLRQVRDDEPLPPRHHWPDVPPDLEAICLRALAKQPTDRPRTAGALAHDVQLWQEFERRNAEEALRESEALYHSLVESLPCSVFRKDLDGRFTFANQRFCEQLGRTPDQLIGKTDFDIQPRDQAAKYQRDDQHVIDTGGVLEDIEEFLPGEAADKRYMHTLKTAVRDAAGRIIGMQGISWDVTGRKLAEAALQRQSEILHSILVSMREGVAVTDEQGRCVLANPGVQRILGVELMDPPSGTWASYYGYYLPDKVTPFPADRGAQVRALRGEDVDNMEMFVRNQANPDGIFLSVNARPLRDQQGAIRGAVAVARDITEQKCAEEKLRQSRERFELAVMGSQDGLWDWDLTTDAVYYSPRYKAMLGYEDDELPNRSEEWVKGVHPDDLERVRGELRAHFKSRESLSWVEFRMRHKDGSYRWIRSRAFVLRDANGRVYRMAGSHEDITERKQAEASLRQSEERCRSVIAAMQDGIVLLGADGGIRECNAAAERILGLSAEQMMGRTSQDARWHAIHEDGSPFPGEMHPPVVTLRTGRPCTDVVMGVHKPDGTLTWITVNSQPLLEADGRTLAGVATSFEDITERKRMEAALRQANEQLARLTDREMSV